MSRRRAQLTAAVSAIVGVLSGVLGNLATDRPGLLVLIGLGAAGVAAAVLAALLTGHEQAAPSPASPPSSPASHVQYADGGRIDDSHIDVDPDTGAATRQEARSGGVISGSSIVVRRHPADPAAGEPTVDDSAEPG
jgi:hypothetical protein